jgi:hypothetical protein
VNDVAAFYPPSVGDRTHWTIAPEDVAGRIRRVLAGGPFRMEGNMRDPEPVLITEDGWRIVLFSDAGSLDYIERVETPDGRSQDDWHSGSEGWYDPCSELEQAEFNALDRLLQAVSR